MSYASAAELRVNPTGTVRNSGVYLNGKMIVCSAYNVNGNNYFIYNIQPLLGAVIF